ncbi:MAG: dihydrofolate reductase [Candidatus Pacebacteria bacterium]|nr:dihydrofolate reductase [Candidatus Paceibacterota bacterium]
MFNFLKKLFTQKKIIKIITAIDDNNGIGINGDLLYKIPADMQHFVEKTGTDTVIMRSGTFESFGGKPLPRRQNIVISRRDDYDGNGAVVVKTLGEALIESTSKTVWIIGGAGLYVEALPICDEIEVTQIFGARSADTFFPEFKNDFELIKKSDKEFDDKNNVWFEFQTWKKK